MASSQERKLTSPRGVRGSSRSPVLPQAPTRKPGRKGPTSPPQGPQSLQEIKRGYRMRRTPERELCDQLEGLGLGTERPASGTGLVYDERMTHFYCLWDDKFPECPARVAAVREKLAAYGLLGRCLPVPAREASEEEILLIHSPQFLELMKATERMSEEQLRAVSERYDSVYLHPKSYTASCLAAGSVLQLVDKVLCGEIRNGLAVVRPPGHHAHSDQMNGYCMFNQLAIAARHAQRHHRVKRVLIVDWDVHHGQGTQLIFQSDPSVLYFSVHRYEDGRFWPHLTEVSGSTAVGTGRSEGFNINVAWNKTGMTDADYITAFLHLLLPVAYEFQPNLVLVAAGFDSVMGDPKGEMSASPACFAHLTHLLMPLAQGRIVLSLEGGYNHRSLAEGVCASLKTLLGDPCPRLTLPFAPSQSALDSVSDAIAAHSKFWRILQDREGGGDPPEESENRGDPPTEMVGEPGLDAALDAVMEEVMRLVPEQRTGLVYDERMKEHYNLWDSHHPELPQRISRIYQRHDELRILQRCSRLHPRLATQEELHMCHGLAYIKKMAASVSMKPRELHRLGSEFNSIYMNSKSYSSACLAAGSTLSVVEAVIMGKVQNGVSIVRPPGHHAEPDAACGFCFFNSVALAARYAQTLTGPSEQPMRVLIVDWDVHHGNGTQHIFQDDASVLYVSLHRYDDGLFFPCSEDASHDQVGRGDGEGFNVNIPWNGGKMGDAEYLMAFHGVVMPIAYEFNPQLVLVSAGFDAARGDPLGGCQVTPEGYAHMTHLLMGLAGGRVVLVLEGGYNLTSISESMTMCSRTLLGDPPPSLTDLRPPRAAALCSLRSVVRTHRRYWRSLRLKMTAPHHPAAGARDPALSPHTTSTSAPPPQHSENTPEDRTLRLVSHQGDVGDPITRLQDSDPGAMAQNCPLWGPESEERGHTDPTHQHPGAGDREGPSGPEEKSPVSLLEEERGGGTVHGPHTGLGKEGEIVEESRECEERGPHTHLEEPRGESPEEPGGESPEEPGGESPGGESPEEPRGESPEEPGGESLEEPRGESPEEPRGESLEEPRVESPTQQLVHLQDLQLTAGGGSSPCVTGASGSDKGPGAPNTQVQCQLLSEAAGGCDTGTSHTLCQLLGDSGAGFAVTPLSWCPHLASVCAVPSCGLDVTQPCAECGSDQENWVCLTCYQVLCGRYVSQHMVSHGVTYGHDLVLSFSDLSVWCYSCETYIHHQALHAAKRSAYYAKFGEEMAMI